MSSGQANIIRNYWNFKVEIIDVCVVSTVPADGPAPLGAGPSADTAHQAIVSAPYKTGTQKVNPGTELYIEQLYIL